MAASSGRSYRPWHRVDGLHSLTLKFPDPQTEHEFLRHSTSEILRIFFLYGVVVLAVFSAYMGLSQFMDLGGAEVYSGQKADISISQGVLIALSLILIVAGKTPSLWDKFSPLLFEVMAMLLIVFICTHIFAVHGPLMAQIKGHDLSGCANDAVLLLNISGVTIFANVFLPIRWCTLLPAQIYPLVCYGAYQFLLPAPDCNDLADFPVYGPSKNWKVVNLMAVILTANVGKRKVEVQARKLFMCVITERTSRVEREFQLDQLQQSGLPPNREREPSLPDSIPTTTSTNRVFELTSEVGTGTQLAAIAEVGRKEHWLIDAADLAWMPERILGVGGFGIVTPGTYLGVSIAIKVPKNSIEAGHNQSAVLELCNELKILRRVAHPNILAFYGACVESQFKEIALVTELVRGVSLRDFVNAKPCNADKARILHEISCALCYLHTQNPRIVHGDLKDSNCFVQHGREQTWGATKLLDFGLSRQITKRARPLGGSIAWMAPEVAASQARPGTPADLFSFGRLTYFVATGVSPAHSRSRHALVRQLRSGVAPSLSWPGMTTFSNDLKDIVDRCSANDPSLRPSIIEVRQALAEKRRDWVSQEHVELQEDLYVQVQAVRLAAARWQRSATQQLPRRFEVLRSTSSRRSQNALEALPEEAVVADVIGASTAVLLHPSYTPTPMRTRAALIAPALVRSNFLIEPDACCTFHASTRNLREVVDWLANCRCISLTEPIGGQCQHCAVLLHADSTSDADFCDICGESFDAS